MTDIEIAKKFKLKNINEIAKQLDIEDEDIELYGKYKAKISNPEKYYNKSDGKLILVTAMSPTPLGEGKTTISISIADGLRRIGKKSILALREPSLGPVFGIKGGATGGGYAQIVPMEDINLHFTGDIHAITSANNLLSAMIDNHIYFGNELKIKEVVWKRCVDLNDRQLRKIETGLSGESKIVPRMDGFDISVASEIMAILCLSENIKDLKEKLGNIIIGYNNNNEPVFAKDLKAEGAMAVLLKDAIKPNLVQTLEYTPALVHGGPFANIAHGCNSIIATKLGMKLADYTVTEAGFGADLGAEKFLDIKCRKANIKPNVVVCVATIKALKYHGGAPKEEILNENFECLQKGMENLYKHVDNLQNKFGLNVIVAINKYNTDTKEELEFVQKELTKRNIKSSIVESWAKGGDGAIDISNQIVQMCSDNGTNSNFELSDNDKIVADRKNNSDNKINNFKYIYSLEDSIENKIEKIAKEIYGAKKVNFMPEALKKIDKIIEISKAEKIYSANDFDSIKENKINNIKNIDYTKLPICIAKTQYSFSDDPKNITAIDNFEFTIRDIDLRAGAGFIVAYAGNILTMPGLPKIPSAENIDIDENGEIVGIF